MKSRQTHLKASLPAVKDWQAIVVLTVLVGVFFRSILTKEAFFWEDFLYQFYPFRSFAAVSMAMGQLPLWNPYTFCGTPFQADIQSALFYIPNLLLTLFVSGGKLNYYWVEVVIILHYVGAGVGMYYLAKEFGQQSLVALFSGLVFMLSGFMVTHAIHQVIIGHVAWLPLVLLLFRRALRRKSLLYTILGGVVLGHSVLAGFPQISLYIFFLLFVYFLFESYFVLQKEGSRSIVLLAAIGAGTILIAIALTAVQLLPTIELAPLSQRAEITYQKSQEGMLYWQQLVTLLVPKFFGSSGAQGYEYWGPGAYWAYWETCFYVGIPAILLTGFSWLSIRKNPNVLFFTAISVFALLYALGDNFILHPFFFHVVPGFDKFRSIGRMTLWSTVGFSLLSGFGLQSFLQMIDTRRSIVQRIIIVAGIMAVLFYLLVQGGFFQTSVARNIAVQAHAVTMQEATKAVILILFTLGFLYLGLRRAISFFLMIVALLGIQYIDIYMFGFDQNNGTTNPDEYYGRTEQLVDFFKTQGQQEFFRVNARQGGAMLLDRNQGMVDQIFLMEGYTPLSLQRIYPPSKNWGALCDLMNAKYRIRVDETQRTMSLATASTYLPRAFMAYQSRVFSDESGVRAFMESATFDPHRTVVFEEQPDRALQDTSSIHGWKATITTYHLNTISLDVATEKAGYLVLSEIYYPGWNAYVDGQQKPLYRADWSLRALPLEAGSHTVEVRFEPGSFHRGLWITLVVVGFSIIGIVYSIRASSKTVQPETTIA